MLQSAFQPDHINYVFLQNQDRHVHLHMMPRYASPRHFAGQSFNDLGYPGHYTIDDPAHRLPPDMQATLTSYMQAQLP